MFEKVGKTDNQCMAKPTRLFGSAMLIYDDTHNQWQIHTIKSRYANISVFIDCENN